MSQLFLRFFDSNDILFRKLVSSDNSALGFVVNLKIAKISRYIVIQYIFIDIEVHTATHFVF